MPSSYFELKEEFKAEYLKVLAEEKLLNPEIDFSADNVKPRVRMAIKLGTWLMENCEEKLATSFFAVNETLGINVLDVNNDFAVVDSVV